MPNPPQTPESNNSPDNPESARISPEEHQADILACYEQESLYGRGVMILSAAMDRIRAMEAPDGSSRSFSDDDKAFLRELNATLNVLNEEADNDAVQLGLLDGDKTIDLVAGKGLQAAVVSSIDRGTADSLAARMDETLTRAMDRAEKVSHVSPARFESHVLEAVVDVLDSVEVDDYVSREAA